MYATLNHFLNYINILYFPALRCKSWFVIQSVKHIRVWSNTDVHYIDIIYNIWTYFIHKYVLCVIQSQLHVWKSILRRVQSCPDMNKNICSLNMLSCGVSFSSSMPSVLPSRCQIHPWNRNPTEEITASESRPEEVHWVSFLFFPVCNQR